MPSATFMALGPCEVQLNGTKVGETLGDTVVRVEEEFKEINTAANGVAARDAIRIGRKLSGEFTVTLPTLAELATLIPGASTSGDTGLLVPNRVGQSTYDESNTLTLKRIIDGTVSATASDWVTVLHAAIKPEFEMQFGIENQVGFKFSFTGFPDTTTRRIFRIG